MKRLYGISIGEDSSFVCVSINCHRDGWRIGTVRRWKCTALLPSFMLLSRPVSLASNCHWVREFPPGQPDKITASIDNSFTACTSRPEYEHFSNFLRNNILSTVPDDALLATLPLALAPSAPVSFMSIFNGPHTIKIGVISDGVLITALSCKADSPEELEGVIERVRFYFQSHFPESPFPETRYLLNKLDFDFPSARLLPCGSDNPDILLAMGAALTQVTAAVPQFGGATPQSAFRPFRSFVLAISGLLVVVALAVAGYLILDSLKYRQMVGAAKTSYHNLLNNNIDIRQLIAAGDDLAGKVLILNKRLSEPTTWGPFLHLLGSKRPPGLFLARIGSEPSGASPAEVRVALAGWCENETIATDFIKILNKSPLLSEVTLSSMERVGKERTICRFKIVCHLSLIEH